MRNALANLGRCMQLASKGDATPQLVDTQKAQVAHLQNAVKSDDALIEQAQVQLEYARLTAPISGITGVRQGDVRNLSLPPDPTGRVALPPIPPTPLTLTLPAPPPPPP